MAAVTKRPGIYVNPERAAEGFFLLPGNARQALLKKIKLVSNIDCPILIEGESGTGKELVAKTIHYHSKRASKPLVTINCATLNNDLFSSILFGHLKGSFTGAVGQQTGLIKAAAGGTIFLDEISCLSLESQAQLLRFLESGEIRPLGSTLVSYPDVRVLAATNIPLRELCAAQKFREDLFYRLSFYPLQTVPLRVESQYIELFAREMLHVYGGKYNLWDKYFAAEALELFRLAPWPGNMRELQAVIIRGLLNSGKARKITVKALDLSLSASQDLQVSLEGEWENIVREIEYHYLLYQLKKCRGNQQELARLTRKSKNYLRTRLLKFGINPRVLSLRG